MNSLRRTRICRVPCVQYADNQMLATRFPITTICECPLFTKAVTRWRLPFATTAVVSVWFKSWPYRQKNLYKVVHRGKHHIVHNIIIVSDNLSIFSVFPYSENCRFIRVHHVARDWAFNGVQFHKISAKRVLYKYIMNYMTCSTSLPRFTFLFRCPTIQVPQGSWSGETHTGYYYIAVYEE